ncbi:MAG: hypothetical protein AAFQ13_00105, partial [Pseudomonadota bacterium]
MKNALMLSTALTLGVLASFAMPVEQARADDCLLDRDNDGNVDAGSTDNDGGADSNNNDTSIACGVGASATGTFSSAFGSNSNASGDRSVSIGRISEA